MEKSPLATCGERRGADRQILKVACYPLEREILSARYVNVIVIEIFFGNVFMALSSVTLPASFVYRFSEIMFNSTSFCQTPNPESKCCIWNSVVERDKT